MYLLPETKTKIFVISDLFTSRPVRKKYSSDEISVLIDVIRFIKLKPQYQERKITRLGWLRPRLVSPL